MSQVCGCRIPFEFMATTGGGESDYGPGKDHFETGSYDLALEDARIENFNVVPYTSVMPPEATYVPISEAIPRFHHGAVLEVIMASQNGLKGETITAGVGRCKVKVNGEFIGGFAAEYEGNAVIDDVEALLEDDLKRIVERRYGDTAEMFDVQFLTRSMTVTKRYGTVLAALAFISYIYPCGELVLEGACRCKE